MDSKRADEKQRKTDGNKLNKNRDSVENRPFQAVLVNAFISGGKKNDCKTLPKA